jgi:hypothetical protein
MADEKQIAFRPDQKLYDRLAAHKKATDAPFQKTLERAVDAYLTVWEKQQKKRGA